MVTHFSKCIAAICAIAIALGFPSRTFSAPEISSPIGQFILGGVSFEGRVWLWSAEGGLASVRRGEKQLRVHYREGVNSVAIEGDTLFVLREMAANGSRPRSVVVTALRGGAPASNSTPLALTPEESPRVFFIAAGKPYVLTTGGAVKPPNRSSRMLYWLEGKGWRSRTVKGEFAFFAEMGNPVRVVSGRRLYIGWNSGEWGGDLQRLDLDTGTLVQSIVAGPITDLATDPKDPGCVLVAVGLSHMGTISGRIDRVCDQSITTVFEHDSSTDFKPARPYQTEPFFSLARAGEVVWAASPFGLRRLDRPKVRVPFPTLAPVSGIPMSFSADGLLIVASSLNQRKSVSGLTPLVIAVNPER